MSAPFKILLVDDQIGAPGPFRRSFLEKTGRAEGDFVFCTGQTPDRRNDVPVVLDVVQALWEGTVGARLSLVLLDIRFDDPKDRVDDGAKFGIRLLGALRARFGPTLPIVMLTSVEEARDLANEQHADGFLPKERLSADALLTQIRQNGLYPEPASGLVGTSVPLLMVLREIRRLVVNGVREFLFLGESGAGKSELAGYVSSSAQRTGNLERWYGRRKGDELHYDQLFGHWRGAFDGANAHRAGAAERAHGGTLFMDEIAELTPEGQTELLEYRQRGSDGMRRIRRLGNSPRGGPDASWDLHGTFSRAEDRVLVDTILISGTNAPVDDPVWRDRTGFRLDLFNSLGHRVLVPPLRDRVEDIVPLFARFVRAISGRELGVAPATRQLLESHEWRIGNIRELRVAAEGAVASLGPDFDAVQPHHLRLEAVPSVIPPAPVPGAPSTPEPVTSATSANSGRLVDYEVPALWGMVERLRTAVVETCRPSRAGAVADILEHATGIRYATTDVKREMKAILEPWFAPNARQEARWRERDDYQRLARAVADDDILRSLYGYASGQYDWPVAGEAISAALGK